MHIYLKHPVHGHKVAIAEEEAMNDEENGWERFELGQVTPQIDNAIVRRRARNMKVDNEEAVSSSPIANPSK